MKRVFIFLLCAAALLTPDLPALADVAYIPNDNFFHRHFDDCSYENRSYFTDGSKGYVFVYNHPDGTVQEALPNGTLYFVSYTYQGWGCIEYDPDTLASWGSQSGWVDMRDMTARYDCKAFAADHAAELRPDSAFPDAARDQTVYFYTYPGSGVVADSLSPGALRPDTLLSPLFTDPDGREWGFVSYYHGLRSVWLCLDDPCNGALPPDSNFKTPDLTPTADPAVIAQALKEASRPDSAILFGGIGVAAIAAAVLIFTIAKKKQK